MNGIFSQDVYGYNKMIRVVNTKSLPAPVATPSAKISDLYEPIFNFKNNEEVQVLIQILSDKLSDKFSSLRLQKA
jgi:hypothetical protein